MVITASHVQQDVAVASSPFSNMHRVGRRCSWLRSRWVRALERSAAIASFLAISSAGAAQGLPEGKPEAIGLSPAALERIAPEMQTYIDDGRVAGMVMMIARHGKVGYVRALGYSNLESRSPLRTDAIFRLASARKPLLAAATMVLVDAGRIRLDDPVSKYIPSFAHIQLYAGGSSDNPVLKPPARPITVRHLLTHTSGLAGGYGKHPVDAIYLRVNLEKSKLTPAEFSDGVAAMPLEFNPGDEWRYSKSFEVIGRVLEVASGKPLERFLREQVLAPLGATSTFLEVNPSVEGRLPLVYARGSDGKVAPPTGPSTYLPTYMVSTPADYMRFGQMLLNGGMLDGKRVLSRESVKELLRNQLPPSLTPFTTPVWDHQGYGFGLGGGVLVVPTATNKPASPGTYRWPGSSGTFFWVDPAAGLVALIFTQSRVGYSLEHHFQRLVYEAVERKR